MTPVRAPPRSAERTTWRRSAAAGWNWWTRWPVGGAPWEARTGGWSGSSWTSALAEAGRVTHPALNLTAEIPRFVSEREVEAPSFGEPSKNGSKHAIENVVCRVRAAKGGSRMG